MNGCELMGCIWWTGKKCYYPMDTVDAKTGEACCPKQENAISIEEYIKIEGEENV